MFDTELREEWNEWLYEIKDPVERLVAEMNRPVEKLKTDIMILEEYLTSSSALSRHEKMMQKFEREYLSKEKWIQDKSYIPSYCWLSGVEISHMSPNEIREYMLTKSVPHRRRLLSPWEYVLRQECIKKENKEEEIKKEYEIKPLNKQNSSKRKPFFMHLFRLKPRCPFCKSRYNFGATVCCNCGREIKEG